MSTPLSQRLGTGRLVLATLGASLFALAGNFLNVPVFFSVEFVFGSVVVMLAVALLGTLPAVAVAAVGGVYTVIAWGHPYGLLTFAIEALVVGLLYWRTRLRNLVLADLAFWLVLGGPFVLLSYRGLIGMQWAPAQLIAVKQPLNGVFNALIAGLIISGLRLLWTRARSIGLEPVRMTSLLFHVLLTAMLVAGGVPFLYESQKQRAQQEAFVQERLEARGRQVATYLSATGTGESLAHWRSDLAEFTAGDDVAVALIGPSGNVLASHGDLRGPTDEGRITQVGGGLSMRLPGGNLASMQRWKQASYRVRVPVHDVPRVRAVLVERPAANLVARLEAGGITLLLLLSALFLSGVFVSRWLSVWLTAPLRELETASRNLPSQIAEGKQPALPTSTVLEYDRLAGTLRDMVRHLAESFTGLRHIKASLEAQVQDRTAELNRFKSTLDRTLDCVFMFDADTLRFFYANAGALKQVGYTRGEVLGMHPYDIEPAFSVAGFRDLIAPLQSGERESLTFETEHRHKDGHLIPVEVFLQYVAPADESPRFVAIVRDITERRQAERALREQVRHTQAIIDNMVDGLITVDATGAIETFNPAAETIFGYAADEVAGSDVSVLMPSPHREAHETYIRNYHATGVARIIGIGRELEGQRKDGTTFAMELTVSEITRDGHPIYVGIVRDITDRKRVERMKNEFVSTVSHELRTPLTAISGSLALIGSGTAGELPAKAREMVGIAQRNSKRLHHLINDLLDIEKLAAGKVQLELQPQPLLPLVEQALEANRAFGAERGVGLTLAEPAQDAQDAQVRVDGQRLIQVLSNLLSNAIKYSPEGGTVQVALESGERWVRIAVDDQGPGIPEDFRPRIFQKFAQADSSTTREKGGTGLGLAISRELVERMEGRIDFEPAVGGGTRFYFDLPAWNAPDHHAVVYPVREAPPDAPRILVVEDEPEAAQLLGLTLTRAGYAADVATDGAQALDAVSQAHYDGMTLDLMLPDIGGLEVIRRIRERDRTATLPIVVVSAKVEEGRLAINGDFAAVEWVAKPLDQDRLLTVLGHLMAAPSERPPRVLHVEDDEDLKRLVTAMAEDRMELTVAGNVAEAGESLARSTFDAVLLDIGLPDGSGWDLLPEIRARQPGVPVVVLSGREMSMEDARKVEGVLSKAEFAPNQLLDAIRARVRAPAPAPGDTPQ